MDFIYLFNFILQLTRFYFCYRQSIIDLLRAVQLDFMEKQAGEFLFT